MQDLAIEIAHELRAWETGWNMGSFGTIAEYHHVSRDQAPKDNPPLTQYTHRGAIHFCNLDHARPIAFESLSAKPHRWTQGVALCLTRQNALMNQRHALTELGPDEAAIRGQDKNTILFDMGLGQVQVDFCIRTADPDLVRILRANEGKSLFEHDNDALGAILNAHPHRVALTKIGRIEVYQMIGGVSTNGKSPIGPHTHILPKLLRSGRTHAANVPIPDGWVPCGMFHPKSPVVDQLGDDTAFDEHAFDRFQQLLAAWGTKEYVSTKHAVWAALSSNKSPEDGPSANCRTSRTGIRNALRQWQRKKGNSKLIHTWCRHYGRGTKDVVMETPGH